MRVCIPELLELQSEAGDLDLQLKLKSLTDTSYFAIHYGFLKQSLLPSYPTTPTDSTTTAEKLSLPHHVATSFLVYYQINPTLQRAYIAGILPLRIDGDNWDFWLCNQQAHSSGDTVDQYQFKEQELKNVEFFHKMGSDLAEFIESKGSVG